MKITLIIIISIFILGISIKLFLDIKEINKRYAEFFQEVERWRNTGLSDEEIAQIVDVEPERNEKMERLNDTQ